MEITVKNSFTVIFYMNKNNNRIHKNPPQDRGYTRYSVVVFAEERLSYLLTYLHFTMPWGGVTIGYFVLQYIPGPHVNRMNRA